MRQILQAGQVQAGRVDPEEQVTDGAMAREGAHLIPPLGELLPLAFLKGHIFTVLNGVPLLTTAFFARMTLPFLRRTPVNRFPSTMI